MEKIFAALLLIVPGFSQGQNLPRFDFNQEYLNVKITKAKEYAQSIELEKGVLYQFYTMQEGMDVVLVLADKNQQNILEKDSPNGKFGPEILEYIPSESKTCWLKIKRLEDEGNPEEGVVSFYVKKFSKTEMLVREQTRQKLQVENKKNFLTADIDHFWEAFDQLKHAKTHYDSLTAFQNLYIDRATAGLIDFIDARNFTAEEYVKIVRKYPRYYRSVRPYTFEVKQAEPLIQEVFDKLKSLYANFKPFKVCFAIGPNRTGGTVSDRFVLIGTEMTTTGDHVDFSEFDEASRPDPNKPRKVNIPQRIKSIIAHECIHTQQKNQLDSNAIVCTQLYGSLREGSANFISELVTGTTNYSEVNQYGDAHENEMWNEFKSTLCYPTAEKWMYNGNTVKDRPADLGYYIGYKITQAYYNNSKDKKQAIIDIIEIDDPIEFLQKSKYDQQKKN